MLTSAVLSHRGFDAVEFEKAYTAADFDRCRELAEIGDDYDAVLARARLRSGNAVTSRSSAPFRRSRRRRTRLAWRATSCSAPPLG